MVSVETSPSDRNCQEWQTQQGTLYNFSVMPCRYVIDKERQLVVSTAWDRLTFAEAKAHQNQLLNDPDFNPEFNQLIDLTSTTALDMSSDEAKMMARRSFFSSTSRRAFLATDPAVFGMGRLMQAYHELGKMPSQVSVFYKREEALKWLGLHTDNC